MTSGVHSLQLDGNTLLTSWTTDYLHLLIHIIQFNHILLGNVHTSLENQASDGSESLLLLMYYYFSCQCQNVLWENMIWTICDVNFSRKKNVFQNIFVDTYHSRAKLQSTTLITSISDAEVNWISLKMIFVCRSFFKWKWCFPRISFSLWYTCRHFIFSSRCSHSYMNSHRTSCWWIFLHLLECSFHYFIFHLLRKMLACLPF